MKMSGGAILADRMDMSWIWRARIDKRCCDVRDVEETVTKDTGSWRAIASGGGATLRLRKVAPVGGEEMIHQEATEAIIIMNGAWKVAGTVPGATI